MLSYIVLRVVVLLYFLVVAGTIVVVILEKRQPVKTMAWVLVLIALPVVGIILFYFFGQDVWICILLRGQGRGFCGS